MALSTVKCNYLTPLHFKGLKYLWQAVTCCAVLLWVTVCWFQSAVALPVLYTGLCTDMQQQHATAVFMVNRFFMQLFRTSNIEIVHYCQTVFGCELPSILLVKRYIVRCNSRRLIVTIKPYNERLYRQRFAIATNILTLECNTFEVLQGPKFNMKWFR